MSVTSGGVHEVCTVNLKRYEFLEIEGLHAWVGLAGRARAEAYFTLARFDICHVAALSLRHALFLCE